MNMLKRTLAMMLVLVMLFSVVPFSVFADETVETTAATEAVEAKSGGPGNSDFGHSQGKGKDKDHHKDPQDQTEATEVTEETVPETTVETVPETTEETVPETTEETVPETTEETVPETTEETIPEVTVPQNLMMAAAPAAETETNVASTEGVYTGTVERPSEFMRVFHLDAGRKYFTVDQVKGILDVLGEKGYSHMELAVGNDALRFLLDDMSVGAYDSATVTAGVKAGNSAYSHAGEWSEDDMDAIIAYAKTKGIEIIPLLNTPGHMDAILDAMEACGIYGSYNGSARTVDVSNATAVAFTQELVGKYMEYFADKGCTYFNIGADEYANDKYNSGSMGFGNLITANLYDEFIDYINQLVAMAVDTYGLRPIAFNDGIYFQNNTKFGTFDTRLIISYWSGGWGSYALATPSFLQGKNHLILNTSDLMYYVMGRVSSGDYNYNAALSRAQTYDVDDTVSGAIGAMQCVWCDEPKTEYSADEQGRVQTLIATLANANPTVYTGPNEVPSAPEPEVPEDVGQTVTDENVAVTAPGLTGLTVQEITENVPAVEGAKAVVAYSVAPATAEGSYTGEATVSIPVLAGWTNVRGGVLASEAGEAKMGIEGDLKTDAQGNKTFTFTVPHFSTVVAYELETAAEEDQDKITSTGGGVAYELATEFTAGGEYVIVNRSSDGTGYALTNNNGSATKTSVTVANGEITSLTEANDDNVLWTISGTSNATVLNNGHTLYLTRYSNFNLTEDDYTFTVTNQGNGAYRIYRNANSRNNYLTYSNNAWTKGSVSNTSSIASVYLFQKVDTTAYTVNPTLQQSRITALTVENAGYTEETWTAYQNALAAANNTLTEIKGKTYNSQAAANTALSELITAVDALEAAKNALAKGVEITINYVDENGKTVKTETKNVAENAASVTLTGSFEDADGYYYIVANTNLALKTGVTVYSVNVTTLPFNPDDVATVTANYWVTNHPITANDVTSMTIDVLDDNVYSETGALLRDLIPNYGVDMQNKTAGTHVLWHVRLQHTGAQQTNEGSDDKTAIGEEVEYIRFNGEMWQAKRLDGTWTDIVSTDVLSAYYLMKSPLTNEVDSLVKDWGFQFKDGQKYWQYFDESSYAALSAQIVYEQGGMNPANDAALIDTTYFFNYWAKGQDGHTANRDVGFFAALVNSEYEIYKVTTMHGTCSVTASSDTASAASVDYDNPPANDPDEVVIWNETMGGPIEIVGEDGNDALQWSKSGDAILIRLYIRQKATENSLTVVYYDEKFNDELYTYNINVPAGNNYLNALLGTPEYLENGRLDVGNRTIVNSKGVTQNFETDLTRVPEAMGKYDSELYTYTGSEISEDGKTLYLYYNINTSVLKPNYVVDFGLPFTFPLSDVTNTPNLVKNVTVSARYGSVSYDSASETFTYEFNGILPKVDVLSVNILFDGESTVATSNVGVTPATSVYYEESFLLSDNATGWTYEAPFSGTQKTAVLGHDANDYGYDAAYAGKGTSTGYVTGTTGASTTFTFTGTGFQLYANSWGGENASGFVTVYSKGGLSKLYMIDTQLSAGGTAATNQQTGGTYYGLPIISETSLPHGEYTVQLKQTNGDKPIYLDGVRILNTVKDQTAGEENIYYADQEDNPNFYEVRDMVLKAIGVEDLADSDYIRDPSNDRDRRVEAVKDMAGQVYNAVSAENGSAIVIDENNTYGTGFAQDLLDNGPKNELYLYPGQTLTFNVNTTRAVQLGLKSPVGHANYTLNGSVESISTTVDMFYMISEKAASNGTVNVTISVPQNEGTEDNGVLSVTLLKICDDPGVSFPALTQEDIENTLLSVYGLDQEEAPVEPSEPEVPEETTRPTRPGKPEKPDNGNKPGENRPGNGNNKPGKPSADKNEKQKDAKLKITFVNLRGKKVASATLTKTGAANQNCVFSADEITANAPARRYAVWFFPVIIPYGSTSSIVVPVF